jgi:CelD/BcsL family acetyltransferase involved in cellulose biosynthesis
MQTVVATHVEQVEALRSDWLSLRSSRGPLTSWADPDRYLAESRASSNETNPYVVKFADPCGPRAIIVGKISERKMPASLAYWTFETMTLRRLDIVYGGLITDATEPASDAVMRHLDALLSTDRIDVIVVSHLPPTHQLYEHMANHRRSRCVIEPHWRLNFVDGSYDETLKMLSQRHRKKLRRQDEALVRYFDGRVSVRVFTEPEELGELINGTSALASTTYQAGIGATFEDTPLWREILKTEVKLGRLRGYWLVADGAPIAFALGSVHGGVYFGDFRGYRAEFRDLSPGIVLHMRVLQTLCAEGVVAYDYGFGDAEYKRIYGNESREEATVQLYGNGVRPSLALLIQSSVSLASRLGKQLVTRLKLVNRLKNAWRGRLTPRAR